MASTYEMIRALPAKGFDWAGFNAALLQKNVAVNAALPSTMDGWIAAKGMREIRTAAMEMANFYVDKVSKRQVIIPPSQESKAWDSFEGGHNEVWNDSEATEKATQEIAELIKKF